MTLRTRAQLTRRAACTTRCRRPGRGRSAAAPSPEQRRPACSRTTIVGRACRRGAGAVAEDEGEPRPGRALGVELPAAVCARTGGSCDQHGLGGHRAEQREQHAAPAARSVGACFPPWPREAREPYRFRRRACDRRSRASSWRRLNGLSGRGRRSDGQCRARDPEHPRRAAIPARRSRGGRLARARPATSSISATAARNCKVKNLEHFDFAGWDMALFAAGSEVSKVYAPKAAAGRLHGDRQQLAVTGWTPTCR